MIDVTRHELLFRRLPDRSRISSDQIAKIPIDSDLPDELLACLKSKDTFDVGFGLFFLDELLRRPEFLSAIQPRVAEFASAVRDAVLNGTDDIKNKGLQTFAAFRDFYPDFETVMKKFLKSESPLIRYAALDLASQFLKPKDIHLLLPFRNDSEAEQTRGMGGPLRYVWRDRALEQAEKIAGKSFANGDCFEKRDGQQISWRSWSSFSIWLENQKS